MKNFSSVYLTEPNKNIESDTNEVVGLILATVILSQAFMGLGGSKDGKGGGSGFWDWMINRDNNKKEKEKEKEKEKKKENETGSEEAGEGAQNNEAFNKLLMLARKSNQKEKDANTQKKNDAMIKLLTACSFDKDGKEIPLEDRLKKMEDTMSPEQFEAFKKEMTDVYEKNKDNQEFKDAIAKEAAKITPESYEKALADAKEEAKATLEQLAKEKEEIEKWESELADMEAAAKGEDNEAKRKKLEEEIEAKRQQAPQSLAGAASGVGGGEASTETTEEPSEEPTEEPSEEPSSEPKEKTKEEKDAEIKAIEDEYKEKSKALEEEYDKKIKDESDPDKKKKLEDEWAEKEKALTAERNKKQNDVDDNDDHSDDDETEQGKYTVKDEEITDPKTGEKKKVKTYTGPRGGKFYYPDGAPKKPENKVYLEHLSLSDYLTESLI